MKEFAVLFMWYLPGITIALCIWLSYSTTKELVEKGKAPASWWKLAACILLILLMSTIASS